MADQIEINIYMRGGGEQAASGGDNNTGIGADLPNVSNSGNASGGGTKNNTVDLSALGKYVSSQTIDVFLANTKSAISQNVGLITGRTELQQRINYGMTAVQQGVNTFKNAQAGRILFTSMGLGGGLGAVVGGALSVVGSLINIGFKQAQIDIKRSLEDRQIRQLNARAGATFNRSREGN